MQGTAGSRIAVLRRAPLRPTLQHPVCRRGSDCEMQTLFTRLADETERGAPAAPNATGIFVPDDDDPWVVEL